MAKHSTELIKYICCKQRAGHDFPSENCLKSSCGQTCGIAYLLYIINSHPNTHSFDHVQLVYDEIGVVQKTAKKKYVYGIITKTNNFNKFIDSFTEQFKKYLNHHMIWNWQFQYKINIPNLLDANSLFLHIDYINKPIVKHYHKTNNQWGTQGKFTYFIGIEKRKPGEIVETKTVSHFIKDTEQDWSMAIHILRDYYIQRKKQMAR